MEPHGMNRRDELYIGRKHFPKYWFIVWKHKKWYTSGHEGFREPLLSTHTHTNLVIYLVSFQYVLEGLNTHTYPLKHCLGLPPWTALPPAFLSIIEVDEKPH